MLGSLCLHAPCSALAKKLCIVYCQAVVACYMATPKPVLVGKVLLKKAVEAHRGCLVFFLSFSLDGLEFLPFFNLL